MRLASVKIQDYKLCRNVTIDINNSLTVLLGKNGSGKSTLLSALAYLQFRGDTGPHQQNRYSKREYDLSTVVAEIEDGQEKYHLYVDIYFDKNSIPTNPRHIEYSLGFKDGTKISYNDYDYYFYVSDFFIEELKTDPRKTSEAKKYEKMKIIKKFISKMTFVETTHFLHGGDNETLLDVSPHAFNGHFPKPNKKFLLDLYNLKKDEPIKFARYKGIVSRTGSGLIDDIDFVHLSIPKSSVKAYKNGKLTAVEESRDIVVPLFSIGENKLYSNQLSEGTFRVLALIFYILNDSSNVLVIEEPELSIHLNLLADVIELIKDTSNERHVILSTHSEKIINMLNLDDITLVSRGENGIEAQSVREKIGQENLESLKRYLTDGGTLGEFLLGE